MMWADAETPAILQKAAHTYADRRRALIEALAQHGIEARGSSGLNVWVPVAEEAGVVNAMAAKGWAIRAGECYRIKSAPGIRVTVSTLGVEDVRKFTADLAESIRPRARAQSA
jgi:DNA-binding transcriptional MocR family regulator